MRSIFTVLTVALFLCASQYAAADTAWMVLPRYSKTGRTLLHNCRSNAKHFPLMLRWEKPGKGGKYKYLSIGHKDGFRFGGINERGLATIFTGGGPMRDAVPPKSPENFTGRRAVVETLRSCATAKEAVELLRQAAEKKLIAEALIIMIIDRNFAWVVECSPNNFVSWELPHALCVYANCWKLPGMDDSSIGTAERAITNFQREWAAREILRDQLTANGVISIPDSFMTSRTNAEDMNTQKYATRRGKTGKRKLTNGPHNKTSLDSYLFESDPEFGELSCVYVAYGPARHTVYLPIPLGAADSLPKELFTEEWIGGAFERMKAAKETDPVNPAIIEFEAKLNKEFQKAREAARQKLRHDRPKAACKILRDCLKKQAAETFAFLKALK